jgi:hypothetical protein
MGLFSSLLGKTKTITLLAREVRINENPASGEDFMYIEGDQVGFMNWLLKLLGLKDPSVSFSISDRFITRVEGKKQYAIIPTSEIHNINAGFAKNKQLLVRAGICALVGFIALIGGLAERKGGPFFMLFALMAILAVVFIWLYGRSGGLNVGVSTFNGDGDTIIVKSGLTGYKLEKDDFEKTFHAMKNAASNNSKYFKK